MYGSDARYIHSLGLMDLTTNDRVQPDFPEIYASAHIPIPATGVHGGLHRRYVTTRTLTKDRQENYNFISFAAVIMFCLSYESGSDSGCKKKAWLLMMMSHTASIEIDDTKPSHPCMREKQPLLKSFSCLT
jgi:hypothetical protein